jgi:hypothetical protein
MMVKNSNILHAHLRHELHVQFKVPDKGLSYFTELFYSIYSRLNEHTNLRVYIYTYIYIYVNNICLHSESHKSEV